MILVRLSLQKGTLTNLRDLLAKSQKHTDTRVHTRSHTHTPERVRPCIRHSCTQVTRIHTRTHAHNANDFKQDFVVP